MDQPCLRRVRQARGQVRAREMLLAPYASDPARSRGRLHDEANRGVRGPRDAFQPDRDRIIHSIAFRRLRHKTQVLVAPDGDHFLVRLTPRLEVAQLPRTLAPAPRLNEDLTATLSLSQYIRQPPPVAPRAVPP